MAIVCLVFAIGLGVLAWRARHEGGWVRIFWLVCALLNAAAAVHMLTTGYEHRWRLPQSESWFGEPGYHR